MPHLPGLKPVLELLDHDPGRITQILLSQRRKGHEMETLRQLCHCHSIPLLEVPPQRLGQLCGEHVAHQGVVALLREIATVSLQDILLALDTAPLPLLLALDQVLDPGNVGAICRSAWAMGCAGLLVPLHNSASLGPTAYKASAGTLASLPICQCANLARALDTCEEQGLAIYGAAARGDNLNALQMSWQLPAVLVLGNEEKGIRPGVSKRCQQFVAIPMARAIDSLNVAQAAGMLLALCAVHSQKPLVSSSANG